MQNTRTESILAASTQQIAEKVESLKNAVLTPEPVLLPSVTPIQEKIQRLTDQLPLQVDLAQTVQPEQLQSQVEAVTDQLKQVDYQQLISQASVAIAAAWHAVTTPFAIFGDQWLLNILFIFSTGFLSYSLIIKAPKQ